MSTSTPALKASSVACELERYTVVKSAPRDRGVITHHKPIETPLLAKNCVEQAGWRMRNSVEGIERAHHSCRSGFNSSLVWRQIDLTKPALACAGRVVSATGFQAPYAAKCFTEVGDAVGVG